MNKYKDIILETMEEMLSYFSKLYSEHDSMLQEYKAKLFEVNIKLDELTRTQNVYSLNTDYRKNVFSPIEFVPEESARESELREEILDLTNKRSQYEYDINEETIYLKSIDKRIQKLNKSKVSLNEMLLEFGKQDELIKKKDEEVKYNIEKEAAAKELARKEKERESKNSISKDELKKHLNTILMIETFDNTYYSTVLDKRVKNAVQKNNDKIESVKNIINTDPGRGKMILDEVISSQRNVSMIIDDQLQRMNNGFDDKKGIKETIRDFVMDMSDKHPDIKIEYKIGDISHRLSYVRYVSLYKLFSIFFDNIYKHSRASKINLDINEENGRYNIKITDDGIGLKEDYLSKSELYSGIHRAKEIIFLLSGELDISGKNGTTVKFAFDYE